MASSHASNLVYGIIQVNIVRQLNLHIYTWILSDTDWNNPNKVKNIHVLYISLLCTIINKKRTVNLDQIIKMSLC